MIVFHSPATTGSTRWSDGRRQLVETTIILTTHGGSEQEALGLSVKTGGLGWSPDGGANRPVPRPRDRINRPQATGSAPVILSAAQFSSLWESLADAGIFSLPEHPRSDPPTDKSYFLLQTGSFKRVFLRPEGGLEGRSREEVQELMQTWFACKILAVRQSSRAY